MSEKFDLETHIAKGVEKIVSDREKQLDQLINKPQALPGSSK